MGLMKMPDNLKNVPAVYRILCIINGKVYIGSSMRVRSRFWEHSRDLKGRKHHSYRLQMDWCRLGGSEHFVFEVLEFCSRENLESREQHYLDAAEAFKEEKGYNIQPLVGYHPGVFHSPEMIEQIRLKRIGQKRTPEQRQRMCDSQRKRPKLTPEAFERANQKRRDTWNRNRSEWQADSIARKGKNYDLISPTGERVQGRGVTELARKLGVHHADLSKLVDGKLPSVKGWRNANDKRIVLPYRLWSPTGEIVSIPRKGGLDQFCAKQGLAKHMISRLLGNGDRDHHKGWARIPEHLGAS